MNVAPLSSKPSATEPYLACPPPKPRYAACDLVITPPAARLKSLRVAALRAAGVGGSGLTPAELQSAYKLPSVTAGGGQTVALVDAFGDPDAEADLATYRSVYGLPACTSANGCFEKVNQTGGSEYPPVAPPEYGAWALEQSLDVDMVSAICPNCHILLVEATSSYTEDLAEAENEAVKLGATEISNSWGGGEYNGEKTELDPDFDHPGIPITASGGDNGYDNHERGESSPNYPASSPYVISVGGTVLTEANNARGWSESVWPYSGSGCSLYEPKPAFQSDSGCSQRTANDVAAVAEGLSVYDSTFTPNWVTVGGTSASSPIIAAVEALSESSERSLGPAAFYESPGSLFNITTGSNGRCVPFYLCTAGGGYNGPTGNGTPDGALSSSAPPPPPILTVHPKGTGSATITSTPAGIECPGTCSASFPVGTQVTLTATAQAGSTFVGWSEGCTGTVSCTISLPRGASTTATFTGSGTPPGWEEQPLAAPAEREPFAPESAEGNTNTFYNVSLSASGEVRAKTIYNRPEGSCYDATSDTGGVFMERDTPTGWVPEGRLTAPAVGSEEVARWANCAEYGAVTQLSGDGQTLLVTQSATGLSTQNGPSYRCAAFVYHHEAAGWALQGTLFPPGVGAEGSPTWEGCDYFGVDGAVSADGTRVAVFADKQVDVFARGASGWSLEQTVVLPVGQECGGIGPKQIALSGDGSTLLVGQPGCRVGNEGESGQTFVYSRSGSGWSLAQTIEPPEPKSEVEFGRSISISEDGSTATIGVYPRTAGLSSQQSGSWVYEREGSTWHAARHLTDPTPWKEAMNCPAIIEGGSRVICVASDMVGFDEEQGSVYVFERPLGGWASSEDLAPATRLFAAEGAAGDQLANGGSEGWWSLAAAQDGSEIDATINAANLANGIDPNDRIGYEFTPTASAPPTISALSTTSGGVGSQVRITGTNLRGTSSVSFAGVAAAYRVDSATQITATVSEEAKTGPISLTTRAGTATSETFTVLASISTIASESVPQGEPIYDTAKLLNASSPTGTITFQLYAASDKECKTPLATLSTTVTDGNSSYQSPPMTESTPGQYQWLASYSGDANNPPMNDACDDPGEQFTIKAVPSISVTVPASADANESIFATATLNGGSSPTGTLTFHLYAATDTKCSQPIGEPFSTTVTNGNGSYQSPAFNFNNVSPGSYQLIATYSGDANNAPAQTSCNGADAQIVVEAYPLPPEAISAFSPEQTPTEATLTGQINTEGHPASYSFEYGTSTSYGLSTPETPLSTDSGIATAGPTVIHGLQPDTTYHYRLHATSGVGGSSTSDQTFTTPRDSMLTVARAGSGTGTVTSSPSGIACPETCFADYEPDTPVTLTATPLPGSAFVGWEGAGCSGTRTCQVTMSSDMAATAIFQELPPATLTVALAGSGSGSVESSPSGIACPGTCSYAYSPGTPVTLTPTAASGSRFVGWEGSGCSGTGTCQVAMTSDTTVGAVFEGLLPAPHFEQQLPVQTFSPPASFKAPAPVLSHVKLASTRLTVRRRASLQFVVSQAATIKVVVAQNVKRHRRGRACKASVKKGKHCATTVEKRTSTFSAAAGPNTFELKLAGLGKGSYTAKVVAENANGTSPPTKLSFTIAR